MLRVLAVDLGASSARVALVEFGGAEPRIEVVHRYVHTPLRDSEGALRWDWRRLVAEVEKGLELGLRLGSIASIGVDTWGVDYGLNRLIEERSGLPVRTGSPEAAALGNGLLQALALGYFGNLDEARLGLADPADP